MRSRSFAACAAGAFSSGNGSAATGAGGFDACATETIKVEGIPLDMFIMLDKSGSILWGVDDQDKNPAVSRWDAMNCDRETKRDSETYAAGVFSV